MGKHAPDALEGALLCTLPSRPPPFFIGTIWPPAHFFRRNPVYVYPSYSNIGLFSLAAILYFLLLTQAAGEKYELNSG